MAFYWSRHVAKPVKLASGSELVALRDAGEFIRDHFGDALQDAAVEHTCELLLIAATSGRAEDRKRATDQIVVLIGTRA